MTRRSLTWTAAIAGTVGGLLLLAACATAHLKPIPPRGPMPLSAAIAVQATPVPLDPANPARQAVDGFRYAGGIALTSDQTSRLHGLSDLVVHGDGSLVSPGDDGDLLRAKLVLDAAGRLVGLTEVTLKPLLDPDGRPLQGKGEGDAEGITQLRHGPLLISFERDHRIWSYGDGDVPSRTPATMPDVTLADNDGIEGLAAFGAADRNAYWVGSEPGDIWLCRLKQACEAITGLPRPPLGYRLSGLTSGPDGELVVLHHSFIPAIGSRIIVTVVRDPAGARTVIGRFAMPPSWSIDNFEGVAVTPKANGDWRLYLLSDDNFNPKQRTLMLAFDWTPPK